MCIWSGSFAKPLKRGPFHNFLPSSLRITQGDRITYRNVLQGCLESRPRRLWPCGHVWPCTFCSDHSSAIAGWVGGSGVGIMPICWSADVWTCKIRKMHSHSNFQIGYIHHQIWTLCPQLQHSISSFRAYSAGALLCPQYVAICLD